MKLSQKQLQLKLDFCTMICQSCEIFCLCKLEQLWFANLWSTAAFLLRCPLKLGSCMHGISNPKLGSPLLVLGCAPQLHPHSARTCNSMMPCTFGDPGRPLQGYPHASGLETLWATPAQKHGLHIDSTSTTTTTWLYHGTWDHLQQLGTVAYSLTLNLPTNTISSLLLMMKLTTGF